MHCGAVFRDYRALYDWLFRSLYDLRSSLRQASRARAQARMYIYIYTYIYIYLSLSLSLLKTLSESLHPYPTATYPYSPCTLNPHPPGDVLRKPLRPWIRHARSALQGLSGRVSSQVPPGTTVPSVPILCGLSAIVYDKEFRLFQDSDMGIEVSLQPLRPQTHNPPAMKPYSVLTVHLTG